MNYQTDLLCIVPSHQTHPGRHGGNNKWALFKHSLVIDIWRISWKVDTGRDDFIDYEAPNFWLGAIRHQDILSNKSDKDPQYWKARLWHNELTGNSMWNVVITNKSLKIIIEMKNHICLDCFIHLQGSWFMKIFSYNGLMMYIFVNDLDIICSGNDFFGAKPWNKPVLAYCWSDHAEHTSVQS